MGKEVPKERFVRQVQEAEISEATHGDYEI